MWGAIRRLPNSGQRAAHPRVSEPMTHAPVPGILPCQSIEALIDGGAISAPTPFAADQVQPASLDLRLGDYALACARFVPAGRGADGGQAGWLTWPCTGWI